MSDLKIQKEDIFLFLASIVYLSILSFIQFFTQNFEWHDAGSILYALASPESAGYLRSYLFEVNYLAEHSSYIFVPMSPFFAAFPYLEFWLLFQVLSISIGISILKYYFQSISNNSGLSVILSLAFLFNPYVVHSHLYPHFEILWIPFLSGFLFFSLKESKWLTIFLLVLTLTVKQDSWIYALGACWVLIGKIPKGRLSLYIFIILVYAALVPFFLTPYLFPSIVPHLKMNWGKSPLELLIDGVLHPISYAKLLLSGQGKYLLLSVLGLPWLAGWRSLPAWGAALLWMSSITLDRAFLSFYYGLPIILLLYYTIPFSFLNIKSVLLRFEFRPNWIYIPGIGLLFVSVFLSFFPGNYMSRGPTIPKLQKTILDWDRRSGIVGSLLKLRSECNEKVFSAFVFGAYLYCGKDLRLPFKHWDEVVSGVWEPDLVVLSEDDKELFAPKIEPKTMVDYFGKNKKYERDRNWPNMFVWRKIKN